jgi:hypothetical protein
MKQVVIMPGGFHPFHAGHYALYQQALKAFPNADVYVAATADVSERPFPFQIKQKLAKLAGVPADRFVQVKSPFSAEEITNKYDPNTTAVIFVRSEKDRGSPPQPAQRDAAGNLPLVTRGSRKGQPVSNYLQYYTGPENLQPTSQHIYIEYLPTVEFGPGMTSATEIRTAWPQLNEKRKTALVMSLYPRTQKNPALAANVVKMLDAAIIGGLTEVFDTRAAGVWDNADKWMGMDKFVFTASNGVQYRLDFLEPVIGPDEMGPESFDFAQRLDDAVWDKIYDRAKFVEFEQVNTKDPSGSGKQGIEGTGAAAEVFGSVANAIFEYIKKYKPSMLYFQAVEPNRIRLYTAMINRLLKALPNWGFERAGPADSHFAIFNKQLLRQPAAENINEQQNPRIDLTPNFPNYTTLVGEFIGTQGNKLLFQIVSAELKPGVKPTEKIVKAMSGNRPIAMALTYVKNRQIVGENDYEYRPPGITSQQQSQLRSQMRDSQPFVWLKPQQIPGSHSENKLLNMGFKHSRFNTWGGTQGMWDRLAGIKEHQDYLEEKISR